MKKILLIICLFPILVFSQKSYKIPADSTILNNIGSGKNELVIRNATSNITGGVLTNLGNGVTAFVLGGGSARVVDTIYKNNTKDSIVFTISGIRYAVKDSSGGGVTQQALNDSIARLDSTIKNNSAIFPNGVKIISDTQYTLSSADAGYDLIAINANTHFIMPDTCPFSVGDVIGLSGDLDTTTFDNSSSVTGIELFTGQSTEAGETVILQCVDVGAGAEMLPLSAIIDDNGVLKTLNKYLYDQFNTIDQRISDTATQIRSEIPDVSNFATITNLADTASSLHSLIDAKVSATGTATLTNKRITARVDSTASSATPAINTDNVDTYKLTAQAVDITSFTTNLSGTPTDDQILHIVIIGTGARAITWGSKFESSTVTLPTTTVSTNRLDVYFVWNTATSKWRCGGVW